MRTNTCCEGKILEAGCFLSIRKHVKYDPDLNSSMLDMVTNMIMNMMITLLAKTMIKKMFKKEVIDGELDTKGKSSLEWVRGGSTMANILFVQKERMRMIDVKSQYIKLLMWYCWWCKILRDFMLYLALFFVIYVSVPVS